MTDPRDYTDADLFAASVERVQVVDEQARFGGRDMVIGRSEPLETQFALRH